MSTRAENRAIRPYANIDDFEGLLDDVAVFISGEEASEGKHYISRSEFRNCTLAINLIVDWDLVSQCCEDAGFGPGDVAIAVFLTGKTLKETAILLKEPIGLDGDFPETISFSVQDVPRVLLDSIGGFDISFALYLQEAKQARPLHVHQPGTWLVRRVFEIRPKDGFSYFSPQPMTLQDKTQWGLNKSTLFYADFQESMLNAQRADDVMNFYVDDKMLARLAIDRSPASVLTQAMMARIALSSLIHNLRSGLTEMDISEVAQHIDDGIYKDYVISSFVAGMKRQLGQRSTLDFLQDVCSSPEKLVSQIEGIVGMDAMVLAGLDGSE